MGINSVLHKAGKIPHDTQVTPQRNFRISCFWANLFEFEFLIYNFLLKGGQVLFVLSNAKNYCQF